MLARLEGSRPENEAGCFLTARRLWVARFSAMGFAPLGAFEVRVQVGRQQDA